jgi:hypothetical protein
MDLTTTIIGAVIIMICIIPLVLAYNKRKGRERKLRQALFSYAQSHSGRITNFDVWPDSTIGLDEEKKQLYFIKISPSGEEMLQHANLDDIKAVSITGEDDPEHTDKLELLLEHKSEPKIALEFFNRETALQINEELQLIKKWQAIINSRINRQ